LTGNLVMSEVDAVMYVVLTKPEKHMYRTMHNVIIEVLYNPTSLQPSSSVLRIIFTCP